MPKLVIQDGVEAGREISLTGKIVLGREGEWAIKDTKISRQHSRIFPEGDGFVVADLNSRNGTLVNGAKVSRHILANGDLIRIGNTSLRYLSDQRPSAASGSTDAGAAGLREATARSRAAATPAKREEQPAQPGRGRSAPPQKSAPAAKPPGPAAGQILWTDKGERGGAFWEDLGQRNFAYKAGMVVVALAVAVAVFYGVALVSEHLFG